VVKTVPKRRVLLGELNSEWAHIVKQLASAHEEIRIVGEALDPLHLLLEAKNLNPDVVVLSELPGGGEPGICSHLVLELPNLIVVLVPVSANRLLTRMVLYRDHQPASGSGLYAAIRGRLSPQ
jgi:chemotaxis response regulator CheB